MHAVQKVVSDWRSNPLRFPQNFGGFRPSLQVEQAMARQGVRPFRSSETEGIQSRLRRQQKDRQCRQAGEGQTQTAGPFSQNGPKAERGRLRDGRETADPRNPF